MIFVLIAAEKALTCSEVAHGLGKGTRRVERQVDSGANTESQRAVLTQHISMHHYSNTSRSLQVQGHYGSTGSTGITDVPVSLIFSVHNAPLLTTLCLWYVEMTLKDLVSHPCFQHLKGGHHT